MKEKPIRYECTVRNEQRDRKRYQLYLEIVKKKLAQEKGEK